MADWGIPYSQTSNGMFYIQRHTVISLISLMQFHCLTFLMTVTKKSSKLMCIHNLKYIYLYFFKITKVYHL